MNTIHLTDERLENIRRVMMMAATLPDDERVALLQQIAELRAAVEATREGFERDFESCLRLIARAEAVG